MWWIVAFSPFRFGYASAPWAKKRDENKKKCLTNQKNKYKFAKRNLGGNLY
jgi:hypothetical protein